MENAVPPMPSPEPAADLSGGRLGDFQVLRRLGQGGMGQVFLAEQVSLKRKVALKIMRADLACNPVSLQRFKAEAEAVARATHANIVQVYAIGEANGLHYMALEYVEGRNLRDYLDKKGTVDLPLALSIMRQVAAALQRASELGIIHRDIKPENILLTRKGEVKVTDFGLSRCFAPDQQPLNLTQSGVAMGTPLYMSPEQVEGLTLDPRTDIYSFGATCYHMLAGVPPFQGGTAYELALKHVRDEPEPLSKLRPDLPAELCALVGKMMAKDRDQRCATCREVLKELQRVRETLAGMKTQPLTTTGQTPEAISLVVGPAKPRDNRRWLVALVALTLVLAAGFGVVLGRGSGQAERPSAGTPSPPPVAAKDDSIAGLFSPAGREQYLKKAVEEHTAAGRDPGRKGRGLESAVELGLIYLEQWRLEEAERYFTGLSEKKKEYGTIGRVGRALVLAFQNKPIRSNEIFLKLARADLPEAEKFERTPWLYQHPQLRQMIARALEYNHANAPDKFPAELTYLRKPPNPAFGVPGRRGGLEKGMGKGPG
jgi:serine/threonine-protein kinase